MKKWLRLFLVASCIGFILPVKQAQAAAPSYSKEDVQRLALYKKMETITNIPWYYFAGVDQYERSVRRARTDLPKVSGLVGIYFSPIQWSGPLNPNMDDKNPGSIRIFGGAGMDGNNDGIADRNNDEDLLYTFSDFIGKYGFDEENFKIGLWDFYRRDKAVSIVMENAKIYKSYGTVALTRHSFVVPLRSNYSFKNTWGDRRGYGGLRIHEGTDIFADYGVPVKATSYGFVEMKGWNRFGGWRIGIRDINNVYHYFAHLSSFNKGIKKGSIVEPGMVVGYVGSSGYGPPGTSGKFPPHLHYGMYRDNGYTEWAFDPYPYLRAWERQDRIASRKH
ncbi:MULTISPECIES: M23 family metallopeptidase [Fictibacillus]|uniref:Peptidase M23 n=1 Tax=Fictibacillus enclensis TaxID=1017270 RepID=A0A0V8J901_9BACL|nr:MULTISPECIES: M23 family metallopeptidase [Fictibacillus]KSU83386.1 peptidase M23 [Fictibacillus enclensis]RXZ02223.1 M23 family peptidase [Fictibacillus sp. S7]SCC14709.1 Peptidase family M23 [Fictibacillus enclensis]